METTITLTEALHASEETNGKLGFVAEDGARHSFPWSELNRRARRAATVLRRLGVHSGDHVATLGPTSPDLVTATFAIWSAGAVAVPLPLPMRLASVEAFIAQTAARIAAADVRFVLIDPLFEGQVPDLPGVTVIPLSGLSALDGAGGGGAQLAVDRIPEDLALIQYTSGSTTEPRGVMLTHANLVSSCHGMAEAAAFVPDEDVVFSWLPLYHDMGLIGTLLTPAINGANLWLMSPQAFLARPRMWLEGMAETGTTITCAPNFAYALTSRMVRHGGLDLSRLRLALNGAEPIDCATVEDFVDGASACGMSPNVPFPVYGLAEATLGVAFPELREPWLVDEISRDTAEADGRAEPEAGGKRIVSEGFAIPGMAFRVAGASGAAIAVDRVIGEIELSGAPVTSGYYNRPDLDAQLFTADGWLRTGDLGYIVGGRLHVTGRVKDLIIVGGRNIYPQDVEASVQEVAGIRKGNVVAFAVGGRGGREAICVVAETRTTDTGELAKAVVRQVASAHGVAPQRVVLVPPGSMPKTSSGKLQRSLTRSLVEAGELDPVAIA